MTDLETTINHKYRIVSNYSGKYPFIKSTNMEGQIVLFVKIY
jgi:hypothetical protein